MTKYVQLLAVVALLVGAQVAWAVPMIDTFPEEGPELNWGFAGDNACSVTAFTPTAPGGDGFVFDVNDGYWWQGAYLILDTTPSNFWEESYIYLKQDSGTYSDSSGVWGRVGLYGRCQGQSIYGPSGANLLDTYTLMADSDDGTLRFAHYYDAGNSWDPVELPASKLTRNAWYKFKMVFTGSTCQVYVNDVLQGTFNLADTGTFPGGMFNSGIFGLYNYLYTPTWDTPCLALAHTYADNFQAEVTDPTPTPSRTPTVTPTSTPHSNVRNWNLYN